MAAREQVISVHDLVVGFGGRTVLNGLSLDVARGESVGLVGGSGSGKTVLLRAILGLVERRRGSIEVLGSSMPDAHQGRRDTVRRCGVLYQQGALFSSLTVLQNVEFPMRELSALTSRTRTEMAVGKLEMVGLAPEDLDKVPSELSGGMTKRVALARALALDPEILFLDEPTAGLDPISAGEIDALVRTLQQTLQLSVLMVTHDLDTLRTTCDRIAALAEGTIVAEGPIGTLLVSDHPWVRAYFHGARAMAGPIASRTDLARAG